MNRFAWRVALLVGLCLAVPGTNGFGSDCDATASTTVLLVRHAEKATEPEGDPRLSPAGQARAAELMRVAGAAGVDAIFVTATTRTRRTAQDLAEHLGLTPIELAPRDTAGLAERILTEHAGQTVLTVGHSNTTPDVIEALGGPAMPDIDETDYDNLFVVTIPCAGNVSVVNLRFGAP